MFNLKFTETFLNVTGVWFSHEDAGMYSLNITHRKHILKDEQNFENNAVVIPTVCSLAIIISNMAAVISVWGDMFQAAV